jgi:hypothetical protein
MMINWKGFVWKRSWPNFMVLSFHSPGGTKVNQEKPQVRIASRRSRDLDPVHPDYEAGVLTTRPHRSVCCVFFAQSVLSEHINGKLHLSVHVNVTSPQYSQHAYNEKYGVTFMQYLSDCEYSYGLQSVRGNIT